MYGAYRPRGPRSPYAKLPPQVREDLAAIIGHLTSHASWLRLAHLLQIEESKACKLRNGTLKEFSVERLVIFLTRIGCDVEIRVTGPAHEWRPGPHGDRLTVQPRRGSVVVADNTQRGATL